MDYKYKYLKYKNKYLVLKSLGGSTAVVGKNPKVGDIVESIDGSEYWGIISKEQKTVWVLNTGRVAQKLNMGSKWQIRDIVLNNKPLISSFISDFIDPKFEAITNVLFLNASIIDSGRPPSYIFDANINAYDSCM